MLAAPPPSPVPGIALRPITAADVPEWFAYLSIPEVTEHTRWDLHGPQTLLTLVREYESADRHGALRFAIVDERRAALAGTIGTRSRARIAGARWPTTSRRRIGAGALPRRCARR